MTGGISISEDPTFRFVYTDTGAGLTLHATDTDGARVRAALPRRDVAPYGVRSSGSRPRPAPGAGPRTISFARRRGAHHADALAGDLAHRRAPSRPRRSDRRAGSTRSRRSSRSSAAARPGSGRSPPCRRRRTPRAPRSGSRSPPIGASCPATGAPSATAPQRARLREDGSCHSHPRCGSKAIASRSPAALLARAGRPRTARSRRAPRRSA